MTTQTTATKGPAFTPRTPERQQFDAWAGKIAAKALDKAHAMFAGKLSEKMYEAYKMGRRHGRKEAASDAQPDLHTAAQALLKILWLYPNGHGQVGLIHDALAIIEPVTKTKLAEGIEPADLIDEEDE